MRTVPSAVASVVSSTFVSPMYRREAVQGASVVIEKLPPRSRSRMAANTDGAEKLGRQSHSTAPARDTSAAVRPSPMTA